MQYNELCRINTAAWSRKDLAFALRGNQVITGKAGKHWECMMANTITGLRIFVSAALFFCPVFSSIFYALYLIAGISDMTDGIVARKTNSASEFGSRFDSIADYIFVAVCLIKLLPVMDIPIWLYVWTAVIFFVKIINIISGYAKQKRFVAVHTTMNKITGALLFALPLTVTIVPLKYTGIPICLMATFAAFQEGYFIITERE